MSRYSFADLLPPYMEHQAWLDLAAATQQVFDDQVTPASNGLKFLRSTYPSDTVPPLGPITSDDQMTPLVQKIQSGVSMLEPGDFDVFDGVTEMRRLNSLGLHISDPTLIDAESLRRFVQNIGQFWYSKGLQNVMDFMSMCLDADITMVRLWTTNYTEFIEEGSPLIGTPRWEGGQWYPTNHIRVQFNSALYPKVTFQALSALFYDLANYTLVLDSVTAESFVLITLEADPPPTDLAVDGSAAATHPVKIVDTAMFTLTYHEI